MPDSIVLVYKNPGQTPLEAINKAKEERPKWKHLPVTYAGRLDPLAEGALLLLAGDECLKKDEYLALPKEYEVTILFGFATDTYDVLGKVTNSISENDLFEEGSDFSSEKVLSRIQDILAQFTGRIRQAYPAYSSRTVNGKPLYQWAREGKLGEITIPSHDVFVESIDLLGTGEILKDELHTKIREDISRVNGDFRQDEILKIWGDTFASLETPSVFPNLTLRIKCGSGVYVRAIANDIGISLGVPALALKIVRTKIGDFSI